MYWIALHFPFLPLEIFTRGTDEPGPLAVVTPGQPSAGTGIIGCNRPARRQGIRAGMTLAGGWALAPALKAFTRDEPAERAALERIASWALQFSPAVSLAGPSEVVLEIGGSLRLFGGFSRLWKDIVRPLGALGYSFQAAAAPTPLAAQWFARAGLPLRIRHLDALHLALEKLPIEAMGLCASSSDLLDKIGIRTVGECLRLPREDLAGRNGRELLDKLDRAAGRSPDPRPVFAPPDHFQATLRLPAPVEQSAALLFAASRLVTELCGLLAAGGKGAQRLGFALAHERLGETRFTLDLLEATRDSRHLITLLRERLERLALPCPVIALTLHSERLVPLAVCNGSFLPDDRGSAENAMPLIERLRARLGESAVHGFERHADHRPEHAWRACEAGMGNAAMSGPPPSARPLWLLPAPRQLAEIGDVPQHEGPLTLLTLPERIESGWWDGRDVAREYYVARTPAQSLLWIYREPREGGWYLHGFFS